MKYYNISIRDNLAGGIMLGHIEGLTQYAEREIQFKELKKMAASPGDVSVSAPIYLDGKLLPIIWSTETLMFVNDAIKEIICEKQKNGIEFAPIKIHGKDTANYSAIFPALIFDCFDYEESIGRKRETRSGQAVEYSYILIDEDKVPPEVHLFRPSAAPNLFFISEKLMSSIREFSGLNKSGAIFFDYFEGYSLR